MDSPVAVAMVIVILDSHVFISIPNADELVTVVGRSERICARNPQVVLSGGKHRHEIVERCRRESGVVHEVVNGVGAKSCFQLEAANELRDLVFSASFPVEYISQLILNDNIIIYYNSEYEVNNRFTYIHLA